MISDRMSSAAWELPLPMEVLLNSVDNRLSSNKRQQLYNINKILVFSDFQKMMMCTESRTVLAEYYWTTLYMYRKNIILAI
mmetsp:Transcript_65889/g.134094  ORF Transcript_65889/g.134094 Transcript_65889/m.134094 type:complete len:81 (+) Transcript_65889:1184-1426(+)